MSLLTADGKIILSGGGILLAPQVTAGAADYRGLPVITGEITFATDIATSYELEFPAGKRLRIKSSSGFLNRPFFLMVPSNIPDGQSSGQIRRISQPTWKAEGATPTVYAEINAYSEDASSWNSSYMKRVSLAWTKTADSVNTSSNVDVTFTGVTIPCAANFKLAAGWSYRYIVGAPIGWPVDLVEVV